MRHLKIFVLLPMLLLGLTGCHEREKAQLSNGFALDEEMLQEGDIVFRCGTGMASQMVLIADKEGVFSHIGIVVRDSNTWKVVHAVPGEPDFEGDLDRVKIEKLDEFFKQQKAVRGALMRVKGDRAKRRQAALHANQLSQKRILFDHSYNHRDFTELYCSELIWFVYNCEGIDLVEDRISWINVPGLKGYYILPSAIQESKYLEWIYGF